MSAFLSISHAFKSSGNFPAYAESGLITSLSGFVDPFWRHFLTAVKTYAPKRILYLVSTALASFLTFASSACAFAISALALASFA